MLNGITQFYQPPTRFIPARAEQDLEQYIRNDLPTDAAHLQTSEGWNLESSYVPGIGVEPLNKHE